MPNHTSILYEPIATQALVAPLGLDVANIVIAIAVLVAAGAIVAGVLARIGLRAHAEAAERERQLRRQAEVAQAAAQRFASELQQHATKLERQTDEARSLATELRTAEERLRLAVSSADIGIWEVDPVTRELEWSDRCKAIFGLGADAHVTYDTFVERVHPDDRAAVEAALVAAIDPGGDGDFRIEYRSCWPDGSIHWIDARGRATFEGTAETRHAVRFTGTVLDITTRMRAEEALRDEARLVETIQRIGSVVTAELDIERLVQRVTDEATAFTGAEFGAFLYEVSDPDGESYTMYCVAGVPHSPAGAARISRSDAPLATVSGAGADEVVRSDDITTDPRFEQLAPFQGIPVRYPPVRSYLALPVISLTGEVLGHLYFGHSLPGIFAERDERVATGIASWASVAMDNARLYEQERVSRAEAQVANRVKSDFLTTMSHELRTPLNAIAGYAELLTLGVRGPITREQRDDLARIQRNQRHLLSLINDILNFARVEAGHVDIEPRDVAVRDIVLSLGPLVEPQMRARSLEYACTDCDGRARAHADPDKVQQVLLNLLSNAIKFTEPGGRVTVNSQSLSDVILIRVCDTGRGVSADKLEQMFEPFVQLDRRLSSAHEGTGLGLAISRELARAMGGDLTAESTLGAGSCFTLTLPRATG